MSTRIGLMGLAFSLMPMTAAADWTASPDTLGVGASVGQSFLHACPPGAPGGAIWGSGLYTSDSGICAAALHSGHITADVGGEVRYNVLAGADSYPGSSSNGVTSLDYGAWPRGFQIVGASAYAAQAMMEVTATWGQSLDSLGLDRSGGQVVRVTCPGDGALTSFVWGSGPYTSDSAMCVAAVHAGVMDAKTGGSVTLTTVGPQDSFAGTAQNGVTTSSYGAWPFGFAFN